MKNLQELDLESAPLEALEAEHRERDEQVKSIRSEMAALKVHMDRHHVRIQTEASGAAPQNLTATVKVGFDGIMEAPTETLKQWVEKMMNEITRRIGGDNGK